MAQRLRVVIEFSKTKERELKLYMEMLKFSNPGAAAKDMLFGTIPLPKVANDDEGRE